MFETRRASLLARGRVTPGCLGTLVHNAHEPLVLGEEQ